MEEEIRWRTKTNNYTRR